MYMRLRIMCVIVLFAATLSMAQAEGKSTVDPNAGTGGASLSDESVLDKPITYSAIDKRLHDIADDLTRISGLVITCGKDKGDWRVRDIPVDVAVKEMPLGKLLRGLAWTTHTYCSRAEREGKALSYRFYRDSRRQQALSGLQINADAAEWAWDALVGYADKADASLQIDSKATEGQEFNTEQIKLTARFIAGLDSDSKQKVLDGDQVTLKVADCSQSGILKELYSSAWASRKEELGSGCREMRDSDTQGAIVSLKLTPVLWPGSGEGFHLILHPIPDRMGNEVDTLGEWDANPVLMAEKLQTVEDLHIPPAPASNAVSETDDAPPHGFRLLDKSVDNWGDQPALHAKVDLKLLKQKGPMHAKDVLPILSEASGLNIICEDFVSNKSGPDIGYRTDRGCTVGEVLFCSSNGFAWHIDETEKTILGQAEDWRGRHRGLVPESLLESIEAKRSTDGAELDDVVAIAGLSSDQFTQWIALARDPLCAIEPVYMTGRWMWRLYDSLSASDKKRAKAQAGFRLSKLRPTQLSDFIRQDTKDAAKDAIALYMPNAEDKQIAKILSDPKALKTLVMQVVQIRVDSWDTYATGPNRRLLRVKHTSAEGIKRHTYEIRISGEKDGEKISLSSRWYHIVFPNYTREREAELLKKLKAGKE